MTKRNSKNSFKMTFKRWGTLAPQAHYRGDDFYKYHDSPVKMGIYAFPDRFAWYPGVGGPSICNGRKYYVRDENGKKIMMTSKEYCALETRERHGRDIIVSPKYLRGIDMDNLYHVGDDDDEKPGPIVIWINRLRTFNYGGNIWHHLEFTNNWYCWLRTDDGIKEAMQWAYHSKEFDEDYDLDGALNSIMTGHFGEEYGFAFSDIHEKKYKRLVKTEDIIRRSGSWILTDMRTYKRALEKAEHIAKYEDFMRLKAKGEVEGFPMGLPLREIAPTLFEVFIEKVE